MTRNLGRRVERAGESILPRPRPVVAFIWLEQGQSEAEALARHTHVYGAPDRAVYVTWSYDDARV